MLGHTAGEEEEQVPTHHFRFTLGSLKKKKNLLFGMNRSKEPIICGFLMINFHFLTSHFCWVSINESLNYMCSRCVSPLYHRESESKHILMRVGRCVLWWKHRLLLPKHLLQLLTGLFFVFILITSSFFSITNVMLITLKNTGLKDLFFFVLFTTSAYILH